MNGIPVFLASDDRYAPFVATTMASICANTKSHVDFYILDGGISTKNKTKITKTYKFFKNFSIEFLTVNIKEHFSDLPEIGHFTRSMYSRLLIPVLKPDLDKAVYSDVDVVFTGDINELYETPLCDYAIATVQGYFINEKTRNYYTERVKRLNLKDDDSLFNSGILLLDCKKWRDQDISGKLVQLLKELAPENKLTLPDQDVLNKYFDGNYLKLDRKWNVIHHLLDSCLSQDEIRSLVDRQGMVHFTGGGKFKPWNNKAIPGAELFWKYVPLTCFKNDIKRINRSFNNSKTGNHYRRKYLNMILRLFVDEKKYTKLKRNPDAFFRDSKSKIIRYIGKLYL